MKKLYVDANGVPKYSGRPIHRDTMLLCVRQMIHSIEYEYGTRWIDDNADDLLWAGGLQRKLAWLKMNALNGVYAPLRLPSCFDRLDLHNIPMREDWGVPEDTIYLVRKLKPYGEELVGTIFHLGLA